MKMPSQKDYARNAVDFDTWGYIDALEQYIKQWRWRWRWHKYPEEKPPYSECEERYMVCYEALRQADDGSDYVSKEYFDAVYDGTGFMNVNGVNIDAHVMAWSAMNLTD